MSSSNMFKLNKIAPLTLRRQVMIDNKIELQLKKLTNKHINSLGIKNVSFSNLDKVNKDIIIMLKHIYIDLFNFIINLESNTSISKEYKDDMRTLILEHIAL